MCHESYFWICINYILDLFDILNYIKKIHNFSTNWVRSPKKHRSRGREVGVALPACRGRSGSAGTGGMHLWLWALFDEESEVIWWWQAGRLLGTICLPNSGPAFQWSIRRCVDFLPDSDRSHRLVRKVTALTASSRSPSRPFRFAILSSKETASNPTLGSCFEIFRPLFWSLQVAFDPLSSWLTTSPCPPSAV